MDGTDLVCLMTNQGIMWDSYEEKSLGSMVTITEDWQNEHRFAATGTERVQHFDFTKTEPEVSYFSHQLILGSVGELSGNTLTLWEDCNGLTESGSMDNSLIGCRIQKGAVIDDASCWISHS